VSTTFSKPTSQNVVLTDEALKSQAVKDAVTQSQDACIISTADEPFEIVALNKRWSRQCGYGCEETLGRTPKELLQGEHTDAAKAKLFTERLIKDGTARVTLINYKKSLLGNRRPFFHRIVSRLITDYSNGKSYYVTESKEHADPVVTRVLQYRAQLPESWDFEALFSAMIFACGLLSLVYLTGMQFSEDPVEQVPLSPLEKFVIPMSLGFERDMLLIG